jgi:PAS domain S-box-containing protein
LGEQSGFSADDLGALWRSAPCGLVALDADLKVLLANDATLRLCARPGVELLGADFSNLLTQDSRPRFQMAMEKCLRLGVEIEDLELSLQRPGLAPLAVDAQARKRDGSPQLHLCLWKAERRRLQQRFLTRKLEDAELAAGIVAASSDAIFSLSAEGRILSWNRGAEQLYGYSEAEALNRPLDFLVSEDRLVEATSRMSSVLAGDNIYFETERRHRDGSLIPVAISGGPIHDDEGRVVGVAAVHRDIRAQTRHEAQLRFVMRELAHRTKNLLAIIQSIERQTARGVATTEEFHERFSSRLQALAASHDLLVETNWAGAPIGDLIERQLAAFSDQIGDRIFMSGPLMKLSPTVAQTIGLALHELATNATKYGALSIPSGRVEVTWGVFPAEDGKPRFRIEWRESGGPPVSPPRQRGFGSLAIERLAAQALSGDAQLVYAPEGLRWTLSSDPSDMEATG